MRTRKVKREGTGGVLERSKEAEDARTE